MRYCIVLIYLYEDDYRFSKIIHDIMKTCITESQRGTFHIYSKHTKALPFVLRILHKRDRI